MLAKENHYENNFKNIAILRNSNPNLLYSLNVLEKTPSASTLQAESEKVGKRIQLKIIYTFYLS